MAKFMTISGLVILLGWASYVFLDFSITLMSGIHFRIPSGFSEIFKHLAVITIGLVLTFVGYHKLQACDN